LNLGIIRGISRIRIIKIYIPYFIILPFDNIFVIIILIFLI